MSAYSEKSNLHFHHIKLYCVTLESSFCPLSGAVDGSYTKLSKGFRVWNDISSFSDQILGVWSSLPPCGSLRIWELWLFLCPQRQAGPELRPVRAEIFEDCLYLWVFLFCFALSFLSLDNFLNFSQYYRILL